MGSKATIRVLQHCRISPSSSAASKFSLPLTFFDMPLVNLQLYYRLLMYDYHQPKSHFIQKIVPNLKTSLSLTLKHFLPIAGNLMYPINHAVGMPELRYVNGDSVSLTIAESTENFVSLKGNHARQADEFFSLVPQLLPPGNDNPSDSRAMVPLVAVQVTFFPDSGGLAIGSTVNHVLGDARAITRFMSAWASINKFGGDKHFLQGNQESLPFYERSVIKNENGLDKLIWNEMIKKGYPSLKSRPQSLPGDDYVRATFVLRSHDIQNLKKLFSTQRPTAVHGSSFVVTCAYLWTCWLKSGVEIGEDPVINDDEPECFVFVADCRGRSDPPIPDNYFGNCLVRLIVTCTHGELMGQNGFLIAAEAIGETIHKKLKINDKDSIIPKDFETWLSQRNYAQTNRPPFAVSESPKYDAYDADFGWGKPEKFENLVIGNNLISLNNSGKFEGGLEVGMVLPKIKMDAFTTIFNHGLQSV